MSSYANAPWATTTGCAVTGAWTVAMTGTLFPTAATTELLTCSACGVSVPIHPEADAPEGWREFALPCDMQAYCPDCQTAYGGMGALKRNAEDIHRDRGGCAGCRI